MRGILKHYARSGETIAERYQRIGGFTSGFDYLRIILAVGVILHHTVVVTDQSAWRELWHGWPRAIYGQILPAFFALSGFLVAASLEKRPTVAYFMTMRAIRLLPALAVEILLSALILGACLTELPLADYFSSATFWSYFLNIFGDIQYKLPGVFTHNEPDYVNASLWTLPYELECYGALMVLYISGFISHRKRLLTAIFALTVLGFIWTAVRYIPQWDEGPLPGRYLVVAFLVGVALQALSDKVRLNGWACLLSIIAGAALVMSVKTSLIAMFPIAYATVYLGMLNPKKMPVLLSGDYSYGLYLFAFPIQQAAIVLFPAYRTWGYNAGFALVFGFAYAAFSWWCVERPLLSHKRVIAAGVEAFWLKLIAIDQGSTVPVQAKPSSVEVALEAAVRAAVGFEPENASRQAGPHT